MSVVSDRSEEDARKQATEAGVPSDVTLDRDPDVLDTWFRWGRTLGVEGLLIVLSG